MSKGTSAQMTIVGRLGRDPEKRNAGGYDMARFSVGVTTGWGQREKTYWIDCTVWGDKAADRVIDFLRKGSRVFVTGEFGVNQWTNQRGEDQFTPTINVQVWEPLDSKAERDAQSGGGDRGGGGGRASGNDGGGRNREDRQNPADNNTSTGWGGFDDDLDDDVPF